MSRLRLIPAALIVAATLLAACSEGIGDGGNSQPGPTVVRAEPQGEPRQLLLGFGALPPEQTNESYLRAFANVGQYAEIVRISRVPPWEEFLRGGDISDETQDLTRLETALRSQYELDLFFAIDPTDGAVQRSRIAELPASIDPREGFLSEDVQQALVAYAIYVATNYEPEYLAIGVEINMLRDRSPEQFEGFLAAYAQVYDIVKAASPRTKVFPTFQLEDLEGTLDRAHPPQWEILDAFAGRMDVLAVSTYPYLAGIRAAGDIRPDYYSQLRSRFAGEIMIAEAGYSSAPVAGHATVGTERDQEAFLARLLTDSEANGFSAALWVTAFDLVYAQEGDAAVLGDVGLRGSDGANKLAWTIWEEWSRRPTGSAGGHR